MNISFVLPMYNEALNIEAMASMIRREAAPLLDDYEIIIVDDASSDGCGEIADRLAREDSRIRVIHHPHNRGLGAAIRSGLAASRMDYVLYSDSDLPVDFACLRWVLPRVTPEVDLLIGYRLGRAEGPRRAFISWVYNRLIRVVSGLRVRDVNFAFKLVRRDLLDRLDLRSEGSFIDAEILLEARRVGCRLVEVGLAYQPREAGVSSLSSAGVVVKILRDLWQYLGREHLPVAPGFIISGDDFGLDPRVNRGIEDAHRAGLLTSASLLADGPAFEDAVTIARRQPGLEIGVHLALTQLQPTAPAERVRHLLGPNGRFPEDPLAVISRALRGRIPEGEVEAEFRAQIERVLAAGLRVTHLDSHQHLHVLPIVARVVARLAHEYGIPAVRLPREPLAWPGGVSPLKAVRRFLHAAALRLFSWRAGRVFGQAGLAFPDRFFGFARAGRMEGEIARRLSDPRPGIAEIGCHLAASTPTTAPAAGWGYHWEQEMRALCHQSARAALDSSGARLASWSACRPRSAYGAGVGALCRWVSALPLFLWFSVASLVVASPVDPVDFYAAAAVVIGVVLYLLTASAPGNQASRRRRLLTVASSVGLYFGFAALANSVWLLLAAVAIVLGLLLTRPPAAAVLPRRRIALAGALAIMLLLPLFEAKEEYLESRGAKPVSMWRTRRSSTPETAAGRHLPSAAAAGISRTPRGPAL